jgi:hypothetical protein
VLAADRFTVPVLLSLAPADALRQLRELDPLAAERLVPHLRPPYALGPTFDGSLLCAADADLIADGLLLDLKTRLGVASTRPGGRATSLPRLDVYQLLAYAFFDWSDRYRITSIGIYAARYGLLATWPLDAALRTLAGRPVDLVEVRRDVRRLLGGPAPGVPG